MGIPVALVAGVSGITGQNSAKSLVDKGWRVYGLSRTRGAEIPGVRHLYADLVKPDQLNAVFAELNFSHMFFASWSRQLTEVENCVVNGAMLRNVIVAAAEAGNLKHVALVTGLKHYLGPFEAYASMPVETPFRETQGRLPNRNFYYDQEDILLSTGKTYGFTWSVHRASTIIGWALGNAMNMGVTLAVYGSICRVTGRPFTFPGSVQQWDGIVDVVDARLLGHHLLWAATEPRAQNEAFNVTNGDVFRWRQMWPILAGNFGVETPEFGGQVTPLVDLMIDADSDWKKIVANYGLVDISASKLASWWHTDADLGRPVETFADMSKSRESGFLEYQSSMHSFLNLFQKLRAGGIIPSFPEPVPSHA